MGGLKRSSCMLVALDVLDFSSSSSLFFGTLVLWIQGLNAAGSGLLYLAVSSSKGDANIALGYRNM